MKMLTGAYTALITPFDQSGEIDYPGVAKLLAWHESEGMDGVVVAGTNGEGPSLSAIEKRDLTKFAVKHAGKLKVIFGAGTCSLPEAIWLCNQAEKCGANAALVLPPYYFSATLDGIKIWFEVLAKSVTIPIILYNFPKNTKINLDISLVDFMFHFENVIGIKDSSGDMENLTNYLELGSKFNKSVLVGDEKLLLKNLESGGSGTISGLANSFPRLVSRQVDERSEVLQSLIDQAVANVKCFPQPAVHKEILNSKGLPGGHVRPPLVPLVQPDKEKALAFVKDFGF